MVRGTSVCRDGVGNEGKKSTSTWAPKNDNEEVFDMKNEGCRPSQGAARANEVDRRKRSGISQYKRSPKDNDGESRRTDDSLATVDNHKSRYKIANAAAGLREFVGSRALRGFPTGPSPALGSTMAACGRLCDVLVVVYLSQLAESDRQAERACDVECGHGHA